MTASNWGGRLIHHPADRAAQYRASGEWSDVPLGAQLHESATRHADRAALITVEGALTYRELDTRSDQIAAGLGGLGLKPLDPVLFQATNRQSTVLAWYGAIKAGLIPVATLAQHRMHEIGHISRKVGAKAHIAEAGLKFDLVEFARDVAKSHDTLGTILTIGAQAATEDTYRIEDLGGDIHPDAARAFVEDVERETDSEDVVVFQLSGGTTGLPKVIPRIHAEYWNNARMYAEALGWNQSNVLAHITPVIHNAGITCSLHGAHSVGAALILANPDVGPAFALMAGHGVTDIGIGVGHYQALLTPEFDPILRTLKRSILSGAKVPPEVFHRVDDGANRWAGQLFGMSEGMFLVSRPNDPESLRTTTVGTPIGPSDEFRILEPHSEAEMPDGTVGELCCRGAYTIPGYFDAPDHNRIAFTSDGFFRTGDLAAVHLADGRRHLSIEGRIKDLINRGGEKINAEEVEVLLMKHTDIAVASVVAMPDVRLGEKACAFLVSATGATLSVADVQQHMSRLGVAKYKWPERLVWVPELPKTNVGKIDKKRLRAEVAAQQETELTAEGVGK
ncbi:(2,3-dihydroxybenzoyl)adenylate synthase [Gordonia lacunae]|uniref:2,3-dihydroxybenzoate-AMP ligase n=1 Tax=Gordonia lacunae TaxID=417102 RepID=A0A243Q8Q2_9ACTN|nr:AMP-binding protein [Gordonia lacunae]OUC78074.1 2,3-dihydroxybenzoate-AMP ligase [Gordonia lacunae]